MFDPASFVRVVAFAAVFSAIEYRYINKKEAGFDRAAGVHDEKPIFWVISPYHLFFLLPLFIIASFSFSVTAWAGDTFVLAVLEDMAYFAWRGSGVAKGEWTTRLFGSIGVGKAVVPVWWPLDLLVALALFVLPV